MSSPLAWRCVVTLRCMVFYLDCLFLKNKLLLSSVFLSFHTSKTPISRSYLQISV
jgi:hypothetical protein